MNHGKSEERRLGSEPAGMVKSTVRWALAAGFLAASSLVSADCACFCMNGELQTMCTSVEEAQADPALCGQLPDRVSDRQQRELRCAGRRCE